MVNISCAIAGVSRSVFSFDVVAKNWEYDLKDSAKMKYPLEIKCDVNELQLYLGRRENGEWVTERETLMLTLRDTVRLEQLDVAGAGPEWLEKQLVQVNEEEKAKGDGPVLVLVVDPKLLGVDLHLLWLTLDHTLLDGRAPPTRHGQDFRTNLTRIYQCEMKPYRRRRMLRCMLLGMALPAELVITCHLFQREKAGVCEYLMGFENIDDVENGLLLFKPLKEACDQFQISFIYDTSTDEFHLEVLDPSRRSQSLFEKLHQDHRKSRNQKLRGTESNIHTSFGDIEGQPLRFMSIERPYKRCLEVQARLAWKKAVQEKWI